MFVHYLGAISRKYFDLILEENIMGTGKMGVQPLEGAGYPLPLRDHRGGIRLLRGDDGTGAAVVAGA